MQACRIAVSIATDGRTMLEQPPFVDRGFFVPQPGASFVRPAAPYRLSETPVAIRTAAPRLGAETSAPVGDSEDERTVASNHETPGRGALPLAGLRIVDLTAFLAGGHVEGLAALGADVIKVEIPETTGRLPIRHDLPGVRRGLVGALAALAGPELRQVEPRTRPLDRRRARCPRALIAPPTCVAENMTPRVVESFGFYYERLHALNPRDVMVRMPAFGLEGPWRDHVGFAYNIEQVAGMAQNGWANGPFVQPAGIVDIVNGQHTLVATLAALRHRDRSGRGQLVEVSQVETVACMTADQVIEYQLTGRCRERIGNRAPDCAPQGIYRVATAGGSRSRSRPTTNGPPSATSSTRPATRSLSANERQGRQDELDALIASRTSDRAAHEIADQLQSVGVAAGVLALLPELRGNPQLVSRRYYERTCHPDEGERRRSRLPVRFSFGDLAGGPAPRLGQHNREILEELGLDAERIAGLSRDGIVAAGLQV